MGRHITNQFTYNHENSLGGYTCIDGYVALTADGYQNVVSTVPTKTQALSGTAYTRMKGADIVLPVHTSTGVYTFTLDGAWKSLQACSVMFAGTAGDGYASTAYGLFPSVVANVTGSATPSGNQPGTDPSLPVQTVVVYFRNALGVLQDPASGTGFWISLRVRG